MRGATLNGITRSCLKQLKKPIHYYADFLKFSSDCLRELLFDSLQIINTVRLPVNEFGEAEIPSDAVDVFGVGIQVGQFVRPLVEKSSINRLANYDTDDGSQIVYPDIIGDTNELGLPIQWVGNHTNMIGENTGGYYGIGAGSEPDTFEIIEERNVIQVNQNLSATKIVAKYISDGTFANAATTIPLYAVKTIETYVFWQFKEVSRSYGLGDAQAAKRLFERQHEILRARKNSLTPELLHRIMNRHRKASIHL